MTETPSDTSPPFPWRNHSEDELIKEFQRLQRYHQKDACSTLLTRNHIGYRCSNQFFQYERMRAKTRGNVSGVEMWEEQSEHLIKLYNPLVSYDYFHLISFYAHTPSQFPPNIALSVYQYFKATHVLDPFAGWGDRCLAAMALGIHYTGIDSNIKLGPCYNNMISFFQSHTTSAIQMHYENMDNVDWSDVTYDLIFSSPPFWDNAHRLFDEYNHIPVTEYSVFIDMASRMFTRIRPGVWIALHIPEHMYVDVSQIVGECQLTLTYRSAGNKKRRDNMNSIYCWNQCNGC
jgi:16S rRNA G966 N2-methylase RsmD